MVWERAATTALSSLHFIFLRYHADTSLLMTPLNSYYKFIVFSHSLGLSHSLIMVPTCGQLWSMTWSLAPCIDFGSATISGKLKSIFSQSADLDFIACGRQFCQTSSWIWMHCFQFFIIAKWLSNFYLIRFYHFITDFSNFLQLIFIYLITLSISFMYLWTFCKFTSDNISVTHPKF